MEPAVSLATRPTSPPTVQRAFHEARPAAERASVFSRAGALPLACAACFAVGGAAVVAGDPADGGGLGGLPACPVRAATGWWCPGCGLTRATHHLFRGELAQALSYHLFAPVVLATLAAIWLVWLRVALGHGVPSRARGVVVRVGIGTGAVLIAFTVVRNLEPFGMLRGG